MPVTLFPPQGLQKQISDLGTELTRQSSWWCVAHKDLQSQIDALIKENQEIRAELQTLKKQDSEAPKAPTASPSPPTATNTLVQQIFCITEIAAYEGCTLPCRHSLHWVPREGLTIINHTELTVSPDSAFLGAPGRTCSHPVFRTLMGSGGAVVHQATSGLQVPI